MALPKVLMDLARDSDIAPEKFAALVELYQDEADKDAEEAFVSAFLKMQGALPVIDERGTIEYRDGRRGTYARNEDIQIAIGPILATWGFSLTFTTDHPSPNAIRVTGLLTHRKGHTRTSSFEAPTDTSGGKSSAQGRGSIISYGHRYTTVDLLNLITRGQDDDGASDRSVAKISAGLLAQFPKLCAAAAMGAAPLADEWNALGEDGRMLVSASDWDVLKRMADVCDEARDAIL
mgnify:CR=1 FL=1